MTEGDILLVKLGNGINFALNLRRLFTFPINYRLIELCKHLWYQVSGTGDDAIKSNG